MRDINAESNKKKKQNTAIRKSNQTIRTSNLLLTMRSCLDNNYYYVKNLLIIMNIKGETLMSLNHYAKMYLILAKIEQLANQITIRTLNILQP